MRAQGGRNATQAPWRAEAKTFVTVITPNSIAMASPRHSALPHYARSYERAAGQRGFTLIEIMVVVVIIGVLASMVLPVFQRVQLRSQTRTLANDFRVFSQAFEVYATQNGVWPHNAGATVVPAGMSGDFKTDVWQAATPIGGQWNWDNSPGGFTFTAGISITNFTCTQAQLLDLDALIDDGNLATGNFQQVGPNRVTYILE